jgi:cytochrome c oxidase subunit 2
MRTRERGAALEPALLVVLFLAMTALTVYSFFSQAWLPPVATDHGSAVDGMIRYLLVATGIIFIAGHVVLALFIWRYRDRGVPAANSQVAPKTEWLFAIGPVLGMALIAEFGVLVLGLPIWAKVYGPPPKDAFVVEVVAKQFEWTIRYPGKDGKFGKVDPKLVHPTDNPLGLDENDPSATDDVVEKTLVLPADRHVVVRIRSHDVLHSFSIPEFRIKQDAVPGFTATTQFTATVCGKYELACTEICGMAHYRMRAVVDVRPSKDFDDWMKKQQGYFE